MDIAARRAQRAEQRRKWAAAKRNAATWVDDRLAVLPYHWRRRAAAEYARLSVASEFDGNVFLRELSAAASGRVSLTANDGEIADQARRAALAGYDLCKLAGARSIQSIQDNLTRHCAAWGIAPPAGGGAPAIARMLCGRWWVRRLRAAVARRCEGAAIGARLVCRGVWPYASQDGVERRKAQRNRNAQALSRAVLRDMDSGEEIGLDRVAAGSVANPVNRRNELMVRVRGCEEFATARAQRAEFWTVTTPSRFHAQRMTGGVSEHNPTYGGAGPDEAQRYLCRVWARARAAWQRRGLLVYGMRVAEPHHDGTPHWHLIAFGSARDLRFARRLLRVYALRDSATEAGAKTYRFKADKIDPARGDAAGYVAKYVAKNIDGFGVGFDEETGRASHKMVRRCDAWASAWRVRQFQFFGVPGVTVWRMLRKVRDAVPLAEVEAARAAADAGDWAAYMVAMGNERIGIVYRPSDRVTAYGEQAPDIADAFAAHWRVVAARAAGGEVAERVPIERRSYQIRWRRADGVRGVLLPSRTRVNNCTATADLAPQTLIDLWSCPVEIDGARYRATHFQ